MLVCCGCWLVLRAELQIDAESEVVAQEVVWSTRRNWLRADECDPSGLSARARLSRVADSDRFAIWAELMASTLHKHVPDVTAQQHAIVARRVSSSRFGLAVVPGAAS